MERYGERLAFDTDRVRASRGFGYVPDSSFVTPEAFLSALNQTNSDVTRLNAQIQASEATKAGSFRDEWHTFVTGWLDYYKRMSGSYTSRLSGSNYDLLVDYANRQLPTWETAAKRAGTTIAGPSVDAGDKPKPLGSGLLGNVKWIVGGVAVIVGLAFLSRFGKR